MCWWSLWLLLGRKSNLIHSFCSTHPLNLLSNPKLLGFLASGSISVLETLLKALIQDNQILSIKLVNKAVVSLIINWIVWGVSPPEPLWVGGMVPLGVPGRRSSGSMPLIKVQLVNYSHLLIVPAWITIGQGETSEQHKCQMVRYWNGNFNPFFQKNKKIQLLYVVNDLQKPQSLHCELTFLLNAC